MRLLRCVCGSEGYLCKVSRVGSEGQGQARIKAGL